MNIVSRLVMALAVIGFAGSTSAREPVARLYRVSSAGDVMITGLSTSGEVSWSNGVAGAMARIEVADGLTVTGAWHTYTHVISTGHTGQVKLWDTGTPEGFSFIPSGTFVMGSPTNEFGRTDIETPHQVTLTRNAFMQQTEVTNGQMADVLNWALARNRIHVNQSTVRNSEGNPQDLLPTGDPDSQIAWTGSQLVVDAGREDYPCLVVTWYGGQAYCNYLSDRMGLDRAVDFADWRVDRNATGYRLPTEAEWEYACRAGTTTAFYTGAITHEFAAPLDPNLDVAGWYWGNSTNPDNPMYSGKGNHPVGLKLANDWGLFDMHGNVWEWCGDWYGTYPGTVTDPAGPDSGTARVFRGGGWSGDGRYCRSAFRYGIAPSAGLSYLGFRPVRAAGP